MSGRWAVQTAAQHFAFPVDNFNKDNIKVYKLQINFVTTRQMSGYHDQYSALRRCTALPVDPVPGGVIELAIIDGRVKPCLT